jgi:hypothetical protein
VQAKFGEGDFSCFLSPCSIRGGESTVNCPAKGECSGDVQAGARQLCTKHACKNKIKKYFTFWNEKSGKYFSASWDVLLLFFIISKLA